MASEAKYLGEENLQLIDFSQEDDYLIAYPFRDSLEDLRLSVTFGNVNEADSQVVETNSHTQSESMEKKRPSFLRKSLAWDSEFFTCAGVLEPEELFLINKGFNKSESHHLSPGIRTDIRPRRVASNEYISLDRDGSHLKTSKNKIFEDVKPKIPKYSKRSKVATDIGGPGFSQANALSIRKTNICSQVKATNRSPEPYHPSPRPPKILGRAKIISTRQTKVSIEETDNVKVENKTRKAGSAPDLTLSKRSRRGDLAGLPKSTPFTPTTKKELKTYCSYDSSSSASSSKSIRRKINPRNTKLSASPLIHSSSTSPASSTDGWSESLSWTSIKSQNPASILYRRGTCSGDKAIQASDLQSHSQAPSSFPCKRTEEGKFTGQYATRASIGTIPFSEGPKRKIIPSGLRMPSPKIGFFDEDQSLRPNIRGSMQVQFGAQNCLPNENRSNESQPSNLTPSMNTKNCSKVGIFFNEEHNRRKVCGSYSRLKPDGQRSKVTSKTNMSTERKRPKDNGGSFQERKKKQNEDGQKENLCSFEDQVNGLTKFLEVIDLDKDVVMEVKGQRSCLEPITPCSRTPLAETKFWKC